MKRITLTLLAVLCLDVGFAGRALAGGGGPIGSQSLVKPTTGIANPPLCRSDAVLPRIQIAILLDTSNSMDGLIAQAKTELWRIINEISRYQRDGHGAELQVALFEYGNDGLPSSEGFVRLVSPLTTDLDRVSDALFGLTTNGGEEYCGLAIKLAVDRLEWSKLPSDYKAIFIAGNEPFSQGRVDWRKSVEVATAQGVVINTIHCGSVDEGIRGQWRNGAVRGLGEFMAIDQDVAQVQIATPYDNEIAELGGKLNDTYVGFGVAGRGKAMKERQKKQDANSAAMGAGAAVERSLAKSKAVYSNEEWDLVDARKKGKVASAAALSADAMPDELKAVPEAERDAWLDKKAGDREGLQKRLTDLDKKRQGWLAQEAAKSKVREKDTFDAAMRRALKTQLGRKSLVPGK